MSAEERREEILNLLLTKEKPITGSDLAERFDVSRQAIVQDVALLRAKGEEILATSQGYVVPQQNSKMVVRTIACKHNGDEIRGELETVIKYGGRVKDVIVEHPIYGELKGFLMVQSKEDLNTFMKKYKQDSVKPLLTLTEGVHLHTIEALNEEVLNLIEEKLEEKGYLLE
ncbi:transcription repressor NadR [Acetohalobium arabaticum]|uniref:3H domain protein n=1 Tax=Acetohalobium arabaticum (strain ATCC 49924 / DSM 5501 / Z-7288) TaxID=574087 RepID=D9QQ13_ACEAZ|nr:transcription repressor NadR [Acetohalobium arabaticum]ADL12604.1 3H domain protein [Acetohalobium arabaticum DSM 5501]